MDPTRSGTSSGYTIDDLIKAAQILENQDQQGLPVQAVSPDPTLSLTRTSSPPPPEKPASTPTSKSVVERKTKSTIFAIKSTGIVSENYPTTSTAPLTEEDKKRARSERNNVYSRNSRAKRKRKHEGIARRTAELEEENKELRKQIARMEAEISTLQACLPVHLQAASLNIKLSF